MDLNDIYDAELLREWKRDQERRIAQAVDVPRFGNRDELVSEIDRLLRENRAWFDQYGPTSPSASDPLSEAPRVWLREVRRVLIPNNWRIVRLLEVHWDLLGEEERVLTMKYKVHAEAFAQNHLSGERDPNAPMFPQEMNEVFSIA